MIIAETNVNDKARDLVREFKNTVPEVSTPSFLEAGAPLQVSYTYCELREAYPPPYRETKHPLAFVDGNGTTTEIKSFGIWGISGSGDGSFPRVLFRDLEPNGTNFEFAVDLCPSCSNEVVIARVARQETLSATLRHVEDRISKMPETVKAAREDYGFLAENLYTLAEDDRLLVPVMFWTISHHFDELEHKQFRNAGFASHQIDVAQQDISLTLCSMGRVRTSKAKFDSGGSPIDFSFERPFLLYIKSRNEPKPYFLMWVDNAELLSPWKIGK